jgi:hypothetical protein
LQLGLRVGNSKTSIGYCLNDHPDAFAESILATWEIRLSANIRETGSGAISLSTQELETVLSFSGGKEVDLVTKQLAQQVVLKRISSDHVKKQLLPSIFYDLASDEYLDFVRSARVSNHRIVGYYGSPLDGYTGQNIYQHYTKELGVEESEEIAKRIPSDSAEKFRRAFLEF